MYDKSKYQRKIIYKSKSAMYPVSIEILGIDIMNKVDELGKESYEFYKDKEYDKATEILEKSYLLVREHKAELSFLRGDVYVLIKCYLNLKNYDKALWWAKEAFNCYLNYPENYEKELYLGICLYKHGDIEEAKELFKLVDKETDGTRFYYCDAMEYLKLIRGDQRYNDYEDHIRKNLYSEEFVYKLEEMDKEYHDFQYEAYEIVLKAEDYLVNENYNEAFNEYKKAYDMLPHFEMDWYWSLNIIKGIGECKFHLGEYKECIEYLAKIITNPYGEEMEVPLWHMRIGQSLYELGEFHGAKDYLLRAYAIEGIQSFDDEDEKYIEFIKLID